MKPRSAVIVAVLVLLALVRPSIASAGFTWTGNGGSDSWDNRKNWNPEGVPQESDDVTIGVPNVPGQVKLNRDRQVASLTLGPGGYVDGRVEVLGHIISHALTISRGLIWTGGNVMSNVALLPGSSSTISGPDTKNLEQGRTIVNKGRLVFASTSKVVNFWHGSLLSNTASGNLVFEHGAFVNGEGPAHIDNRGTLRISRPLLPVVPESATLQDMMLNTSGIVNVEAGKLELVSGQHQIAKNARFTGAGITRLSEGTSTPDGWATLHGPVSLAGGRFELGRGGHLDGTGSFVGGGVFRWTGGVIEGTVTIPAQTPRNRLKITGFDAKELVGPSPGATGGKLVNGGMATFEGSGKLLMSSAAVFENAKGGTLTMQGGVLVEATACCVSPARIVNRGILISKVGNEVAILRGPSLENRGGVVRLRTGTLDVNLLPYTQTSGRTVLGGGTISSNQPVVLKGGTLQGTGRLDTSLRNLQGIVAPGAPVPANSMGAIRVLGQYFQTRKGTLQIDVKGATGHDRLDVLELATLDGNLHVVRAPSYVPNAADRLKILTAGSRERGFRKLTPSALPAARAYFAAYQPAGVVLRTMTSFPGLDKPSAGHFIPPDTTIAVTAGHVIEATNSAVRLMTRSGGTPQPTPLKTFFGAPAASRDPFDPKVIFDRIGRNRRVYLIAAQKAPATKKSIIWLAVSRSNDPASLNAREWCRYPIDATSSEPEPGWADFPGIATGGSSVVITTNQATFVSPPAEPDVTHTEVRVLSKAALANNATRCPPLPAVRKLRASSTNYDKYAISLAPVQPLTPPTPRPGAPDPIYLVSVSREESSTYRVWRISGTPAGPSKIDVTVAGSFTFKASPASPQPRGGTKLESIDARIRQAVGLGDTIWAVHATRCNDVLGGDEESCVRAVRIEMGADGNGAPTATISHEENIGEAGDFYTFPGVAVNKRGQTLIVFEASGPAQSLSTWWTMKNADETSFRPANQLTSGDCSQTDKRFGDYTGAQTDPLNNTTFWFAGERATKLNGTCQWATQIGGVTP